MVDVTPASPATDRPDPNQRRLLLLALVPSLLLVLVAALWAAERFGWLEPEPEVLGADAAVVELLEVSRLEVATGTYQVPVFIDATPETGLQSHLPDLVSAERITSIYEGDVDATIDLSGLDESDVTVDEETNSVTIRVPEPVLSAPRIDHSRTEIVSHERGVVQRMEDALGDTPLDTHELDSRAAEGISHAAEDSDLPRIARDNGTETLTRIGEALGYDEVTVEYVPGRN